MPARTPHVGDSPVRGRYTMRLPRRCAFAPRRPDPALTGPSRSPPPMSTKLASLKQWVDDVARLTQPDRIHWCDGSDAEHDSLVAQMLATGDLVKLNEQTHPNRSEERRVGKECR